MYRINLSITLNAFLSFSLSMFEKLAVKYKLIVNKTLPFIPRLVACLVRDDLARCAMHLAHSAIHPIIQSSIHTYIYSLSYSDYTMIRLLSFSVRVRPLPRCRASCALFTIRQAHAATWNSGHFSA